MKQGFVLLVAALVLIMSLSTYAQQQTRLLKSGNHYTETDDQPLHHDHHKHKHKEAQVPSRVDTNGTLPPCSHLQYS